MNRGKIKDFLSHLCLAGAVVASWSLTLEATGLSPFNDLFIIEFSEFSELGKYFHKDTVVLNLRTNSIFCCLV